MSVAEGAQIEVDKEAPTKVEDPNDPQGPPKEPAVKRQHLIVMRHGERIDEVIFIPCLGQGSKYDKYTSVECCHHMPCRMEKGLRVV